jgi:hypothetical protein
LEAVKKDLEEMKALRVNTDITNHISKLSMG